MPLTQEKRMDNFPNSNDHSYLHKKFKKMASPISVLPVNSMKSEESVHKELGFSQITGSPNLKNGTISAAHPEIEKIKDKYANRGIETDNIVQTNYNDEICRLSGVNNYVQITGKTSYNDEFLNKTENGEIDVTKDTYSGGTGRYICPYCKLPCAKPSVLQKHIRAHTNERPYPCIPCGFAFKTKSNLYKHKRSRTHALRSQGADVSVAINEEDLSGGSESDTSSTPTFMSDPTSDASLIRFLNTRPNDFSSPELASDGNTQISSNSYNDHKSKTIYKPKFRAALYQGNDDKDKIKKSISHNAEFLTEHISKIISDNEAIVDVIETPLQKKYGKIKQIAESKQFSTEIDIKSEVTPLNLTKNSYESESLIRKRSHSESFALTSEDHKHPLNPEGSIIKDLLLKTKANGLNSTNSLAGELVDGLGPLYVCSQCQIVYRSADNLEIHRSYYCKGALTNNCNLSGNVPKEAKYVRPDNGYVRSNSINVRLPETSASATKVNYLMNSPPIKNKPDNLVILKTECSDVIAPLPSPGPLLGNTRLVDSRLPSEYNKKTEGLKLKTKECSPKRRFDSRSETNSPRLIENISPRSADLYVHSKIRCVDINSPSLRTIEEISPHIRHNSTSLQMFGGEVKIVDHSGSTTTLRIEPSKTQLSPILIHQNLSPSKFSSDSEASSVVVRSGLHSGGTIVHNPPTPKETINNHQVQTPRVASSTPNGQNTNVHVHDIPHFQFPPLSAITAYNPLTLPPLSPSPSPNGATTIMHGGKLIPHVPGIPGPNTPGLFMTNSNLQMKSNDSHKSVTKTTSDNNQHLLTLNVSTGKGSVISNYDRIPNNSRSPNIRSMSMEAEHNIINKDTDIQNMSSMPIIKIKHVDEPILKNFSSSGLLKSIKRNADGIPKHPVLKENMINTFNKNKNKDSQIHPSHKVIDIKAENDIKNFNFENFITKAEIYNNQIQNKTDVDRNSNVSETFVTSVQNERSETSYFQKGSISKSNSEERKPKFLRPSTLPLKPGTFTPKRHHGITPNANTMPLVSPETPRPAKAYGQLYLNGNAYTYLGLKCSTKVFYCTINRPQPTYVPNQHFLSMYSNWQLLSELTPDPLGLSASSAMSLYDSRHRPQSLAVSVIKQDLILTHSSQWNKNSKDGKQVITSVDSKKSEEIKNISDNTATSKKELTGGFESNEEYTYVRGRGRGRYVCSECGIRCKKPSMLKKHIRTHTDVRPYTCVHCVFSFKTKGNLTKHMKSKAHYKKCCELGINPNEGNDAEGSEMAQCSGETDDETDSDGDEGNEGETESSDTEVFKSRLPEHEAAHCLLSLGGSRPATSATPGLITSARPTTYPYTPMLLENTLDVDQDKVESIRTPSTDSRIDMDNEPMDLSKNELRTPTSVMEIPTERESSVMACLASNTAKLPHHQSQWTNGEPMLHTYLTERALLDSKIKQSQLTCNSKIRKIDLENSLYLEKETAEQEIPTPRNVLETITTTTAFSKDESVSVDNSQNCLNLTSESRARTPNNSNPENAKHVVSEYLKHARINHMKTLDDPNHLDISSDESNSGKINIEEKTKVDEVSDCDGMKLSSSEYDPVASKVVIGVGGVFKVTKGKEFEGSASYSPGKLMEDGRRVCDFCNKTFTKPSQLRLHLNIHYMERPFRCSVCAVSFRTRGHLQKHERSGSHHNKVSMTSTFGAATSCNPRPFRCSDCNIAFRIHGHLAKHLRSKMHVMRLECLFKLPFGTFTEIERAGLSLTDIDTTDCASSLASLQSLARKLHEKDPSKLEYREPSGAALNLPAGRESSEDEDALVYLEKNCDSLKDSEIKTVENSDCQETETRVNYSATDN
ncbi:unnamed protein product [Danaus chrysippus]|uniref:(African queen) hypothetical protein n=1 Tax=Danaus chrysippus TaxID=151541 RepID=A0A8J2W639_9NEOP|nr:unnamed protein product [Danaus chrysippus]